MVSIRKAYPCHTLLVRHGEQFPILQWPKHNTQSVRFLRMRRKHINNHNAAWRDEAYERKRTEQNRTNERGRTRRTVVQFKVQTISKKTNAFSRLHPIGQTKTQMIPRCPKGPSRRHGSLISEYFSLPNSGWGSKTQSWPGGAQKPTLIPTSKKGSRTHGKPHTNHGMHSVTHLYFAKSTPCKFLLWIMSSTFH